MAIFQYQVDTQSDIQLKSPGLNQSDAQHESSTM